VNIALLVVLAGLMHATRSFSVGDEPGTAGTSLALGYLLVSGHFAGHQAQRLRLPKLTGYLVTGLLVGPAVLGLISTRMLESLELVNGMAVAMIALTAGTELELNRLRPLARTVAAITVIGVLGTACLLALAAWLVRPLLPFLATMEPARAAIVVCVLGIVMAAQSPAVVVALRDELRADGPVTRAALGVVVLADLVVILVFAVLSTITKVAFGASADVSRTLMMLAWEILGSVIAGLLIGGVLIVYLRKVKEGTALFLLAVTFIMAEVGGRLGLDPLLLALASGALVRNASNVADELHEELQVSALPVYVLFFCVAGATLHVEALALVWMPATLFIVVRAAGLLAGARLGAGLAGAPSVVQRYVGFGLLPQAGLALALSMLFARTFPEFGAEAGALTMSVVALNELLAPVAYRWAIERSGEAGAESPRPSHDHATEPVGPEKRPPFIDPIAGP